MEGGGGLPFLSNLRGCERKPREEAENFEGVSGLLLSQAQQVYFRSCICSNGRVTHAHCSCHFFRAALLLT